jgi:hypothetical protein
MAVDLSSAEYAFLIILNDADRAISNSEMDQTYRVRLIGPNCARLNDARYVETDRTHKPYRHVLTPKGRERLAERWSIDDDKAGKQGSRTARDTQLWVAIVALHNLLAKETGTDLEDRIRAGYSELAAGPGEWVDLTALRPLLGGASKAEVDEALVRMLAAPGVHLEPEPFGHRIGPAERRAAVHVGGEDRHKLAIGL